MLNVLSLKRMAIGEEFTQNPGAHLALLLMLMQHNCREPKTVLAYLALSPKNHRVVYSF